MSFPTWGFFSITGFPHYIRTLKSVQKIIRSEGVGDVHCATLLPEGWIAWLLKRRYGLPYVCYVHGEELNVGRGSRELGWLMRRVLGEPEASSRTARTRFDFSMRLGGCQSTEFTCSILARILVALFPAGWIQS